MPELQHKEDNKEAWDKYDNSRYSAGSTIPIPLPKKFPCLAHVIQIAIRALFEELKIAPINND